MNIRMGGVVCVGMMMLCRAAAQSNSDAGWVGVWQGELDGQPSVVLTLAEDTGTLEGTLVLNIISRDGGEPHIVAHQPHVVVRPRIDGDRLSFQLKRLNASMPMMDFTVTLTGERSARIHCLNCGDSAPAVAMTKEARGWLLVSAITGNAEHETAMLFK
jgi:hypothetical protein